MPRRRRSGCPISFSLDLFGDRWSLLILRDLVFGQRRYYGAFLQSGEGIATNVLADRLDRLERAGLLSRRRDPDDRKRFVYRITEKGFETVPILLEMIVWGATHDGQTAIGSAYVERIRSDRAGVLAEVRARLEQSDLLSYD